MLAVCAIDRELLFAYRKGSLEKLKMCVNDVEEEVARKSKRDRKYKLIYVKNKITGLAFYGAGELGVAEDAGIRILWNESRASRPGCRFCAIGIKGSQK